MDYSCYSFSLLLLFLFGSGSVSCTTFTFVNRCGDTVWPGMLSNSGRSPLETTGFALPAGGSRSLLAPTGWSGRFWGRTGCSFDPAGRGSCSTGDCGSGQVECNGAGADPPVTLIEFTLAGSDGKDFYDVSLVDGYNLPVVVEATTTAINTASTTADTDTVGCAATGCAADLNQRCPAELKVGDGEACRSACEAFGTPEYCCSGEFGSPDTCRPSVYSQMFKSACPRSYSYAYDDATSTFTCATAAAADYVITFCPDSTVSQKSTKSSSPSKPSEAVFDDDSWIASLATGGVSAATRRRTFSIVEASLTIAAIICFLLH
ncbi:thaumatin-like protein 1b isoform X2 [Ananas comosus]|uniref:Thaumatin-like protein 1b isoform X2 n=1 Tax=Ananas comosus TaxID=4615 RepID=A0A6P5H258_ANACO|nr:thaumatin-like protein 1b isoform X2 [Ananas comosus]